MSKTATSEPSAVQVPCAFCRGTGKDPFGIMSQLAACCVCFGKGSVAVKAPYEPCAHCGGTGAIKRFTCAACRGKGVLPAIEGPTVACPECKGTGDQKSAPAMACLKCRGRGKVPVPETDEDSKPSRKKGAE